MLLIRVTVCGIPGVLPLVGRVANPRFRVTKFAVLPPVAMCHLFSLMQCSGRRPIRPAASGASAALLRALHLRSSLSLVPLRRYVKLVHEMIR